MTESRENQEVPSSQANFKTQSKDVKSKSQILSNCCCIFKKKFSSMDKEERKERIDYLWKKLRMVVKSHGLLADILRNSHQKERERFGLDPHLL